MSMMFSWLQTLLVLWLQSRCTAWINHGSAGLGSRRITNPLKLMENEHELAAAGRRQDVKLLVIDHYDSFTYNLVDLLAQFCIQPPTVLAADSLELPYIAHFDGIVLSPGPGHPSDEICNLAKSCVERHPNVPILGVCLGHQILGESYGATVDLAPTPIHGQIKKIQLLEDVPETDPLWSNIEKEIAVTRYHSLQVTNLEQTPLIPTAISDDNVLMAMRHATFPHFGVQFHPESIGTNETGKLLLHNFVNVCQELKKDAGTVNNCVDDETLQTPNQVIESVDSASQQQRRVFIHKVEDLPPNGANMQPVDVMEELLSKENYSFWLDEAQADGNTPAISILGASNQRVEYWGKEKDPNTQGVFVWNKENESPEQHKTDILSYLQSVYDTPVDRSSIVSIDASGDIAVQETGEDDLASKLPFGYRGGHIGYLGYEVRFDTMRFLEQEERGVVKWDSKDDPSHIVSDPNVPTAAFLWADRSFVYDHQACDWYLIGVAEHNKDEADVIEWIGAMAARLQSGRRYGLDGPETHPSPTVSTTFVPKRSRETYNRNFEQCMHHINQGDSYELCLTNQLEATVPKREPLDLYSDLRRRNAAPFSAFFNWNANQQEAGDAASLAICCSSPERFVSVKQNDGTMQAEAKPIKGTIARVTPLEGRSRLTESERELDATRAQILRDSVKDRAENLMIVDLLRNDLSRVCKTGTVHVSKLMDIESFATVHQMVSTIRGQVTERSSAIGVLKACFPGGSMTGAPKRRTMELLNTLEENVARGPYSGCLGYLSVNGCMDMNIVIRTAILTPSGDNDAEWKVRIGAGGAITTLSESVDEYSELMLKASAVMKAVDAWASNKQGDVTVLATNNTQVATKR